MSDPADEGPSMAASDIRPLVASPASNLGLWAFGAVLVVGAVLLFAALDARRTALTAPTTMAAPDVNSGVLAAPPELTIPPQYGAELAYPYGPGWQQAPVVLQTVPAQTIPPAAQPARIARVSPPPAGFGAASPFPPAPSASGQNAWTPPQLGTGSGPGAGPSMGGNSSAIPRPSASSAPGASGKERVEASRFANPATTVPKGTVVQAVLESALDSTRGGFARAIVSRDIYSFDGSRVLVQRGSRILGEYKSDISLGQKRILIQWQRLMRPDGVMIDLDSPSADPLGRAGVTGSVNTHFFERFAGAILQSSLDIGVQLATRAATRSDTVVLALPGSVNQATQTLQPEKIPPTVKVKQGSSVSVFVARDLDFTDVGG